MEERKYEKSYNMNVWDRLSAFFYTLVMFFCGVLGSVSSIGIMGVVFSDRSLYGPTYEFDFWIVLFAIHDAILAFLFFFVSFEHFRFLWNPNEETKRAKDKSLQVLFLWVIVPIVLVILNTLLQKV